VDSIFISTSIVFGTPAKYLSRARAHTQVIFKTSKTKKALDKWLIARWKI